MRVEVHTDLERKIKMSKHIEGERNTINKETRRERKRKNGCRLNKRGAGGGGGG